MCAISTPTNTQYKDFMWMHELAAGQYFFEDGVEESEFRIIQNEVSVGRCCCVPADGWCGCCTSSFPASWPGRLVKQKYKFRCHWSDTEECMSSWQQVNYPCGIRVFSKISQLISVQVLFEGNRQLAHNALFKVTCPLRTTKNSHGGRSICLW